MSAAAGVVTETASGTTGLSDRMSAWLRSATPATASRLRPARGGLCIPYETVRRWVLKFGPAIARRLRQRRPRPSNRWHLDEMVVRIAGERMYLWRGAGHEGEGLHLPVQGTRG